MILEPHEEFMVWRRREGLSQFAAALRYKVSQGYISHMELGVRDIKPEILEAMPDKIEPTEGEQLYVLMRRQGWDMNMAVHKFDSTHANVLKMIRDELAIPSEYWGILEADRKRFA
jgi:predicted transcriptional regulator